MPAKERLELLDEIHGDESKVTVSEVAEMFGGTLFIVLEQTEAGKMIDRRLSEREKIIFVNSLANSFLSTLYVNAADTEKEKRKRMKTVSEANFDLMVQKEGNQA